MDEGGNQPNESVEQQNNRPQNRVILGDKNFYKQARNSRLNNDYQRRKLFKERNIPYNRSANPSFTTPKTRTSKVDWEGGLCIDDKARVTDCGLAFLQQRYLSGQININKIPLAIVMGLDIPSEFVPTFDRKELEKFATAVINFAYENIKEEPINSDDLLLRFTNNYDYIVNNIHTAVGKNSVIELSLIHI